MTTAFKRIQMDKESTPGTEVDGVTQLLGRLTVTPNITRYHPEDNERNSFALLHNDDVIVSQQSDLVYEGDLSFEQIPHLLVMAMKGGVSGAQVSATTAYEWTFTPSMSAANVPDQGTKTTYTFEYGDDTAMMTITYVFGTEIQFTYALGQPIKVRVNLVGKLLDATKSFGTLTSGGEFGSPTITYGDVEYAVSQKTSIYVDTTWSGLGSTKKSGLLVGGTVTLPSGFIPDYFHDGSLDFSSIGEMARAGTVELIVVHNADGNAELDKFLASPSTQVFIRLETLGSLIESGQTNTFRLDMAIKWLEPPELFGEDHNGNTAYRLRGRIIPNLLSTGNTVVAYVKTELDTLVNP